jgi:hypothetical protein
MIQMVCESMSGCICKLMVYDASGMTLQGTVFELLNPYLQQGYTVYMDNYYNSAHMVKQLHEQSTGVCGTFR